MFLELECHQAYRTTSLPWLETVPSHWELKRNKAILSEARELVGASSATTQLLALTKRGVVTRDMANLEGKVPASFDTYQHLDAGDLIFCLFDIDETPRTVGLVREPGMITGAYTRMRVVSDASAAYLAHFYTVLDDQKALRPLYTGLRKSIRTDAFLAVETPVPPADEQAAIVKYLGHAHARIDRAIAAKRKLIALLEEQKQAIIRQAVTRGLDPSVPLKNSGVPWLGEIPAHWITMPLKHVARRAVNGTTPSTVGPDYFSGGVIPWVTPSGVSNELHVSPDAKRLTLRAFEDRAARLVRGPAIFVVVIGTCGKSALSLDDASSNQQLTAYELNTTLVDPAFIAHQFRLAEPSLRGGASSSTIPLISTGTVATTTLAVPSIAEQREIAHRLESTVLTQRAVRMRASLQIELLREFRMRLTSDVVTGQVDVRKIAAALPELTDDMLANASDDAVDTDLEDAEDFTEGEDD